MPAHEADVVELEASRIETASARRRIGLAGRLAALAALGAVVVSLQARIDARWGEFRKTEEILYIENGKLLRKVLLGFESLAADLYWLRAVQYFGGQRLYDTEKKFALLEPLLEITTDLDPHLKIAYSYGAIFLSEPWPRGAGQPRKGIALVDKGIAANPDYWRFFLDKGFIYFWHLEEPKKAAEIFVEGSRLPGAPYWMTAMAARALTKGGERQTARLLWRALYETAENEQMRSNALVHLQYLDGLDAIDELEAIVGRFRERKGRYPRDWEEVRAAGLIPGLPVDPKGKPYVLDPTNGTVAFAPDSPLAAMARTVGFSGIR